MINRKVVSNFSIHRRENKKKRSEDGGFSIRETREDHVHFAAKGDEEFRDVHVKGLISGRFRFEIAVALPYIKPILYSTERRASTRGCLSTWSQPLSGGLATSKWSCTLGQGTAFVHHQVKYNSRYCAESLGSSSGFFSSRRPHFRSIPIVILLGRVSQIFLRYV